MATEKPEPKTAPRTEPRKTTPSTTRTATSRQSYTDRSVKFAADARNLAEDIRTKARDFQDAVDAYVLEVAPEPYEESVKLHLRRVTGAVTDLAGQVDGIIATAADLDRATAEVTPPEEPKPADKDEKPEK